jgi:ATP-binding cassette subfamily B protein
MRIMQIAFMHKILMIFSCFFAVLSSAASFAPYIAVYFIIGEIMAVYPNFYEINSVVVMNYAYLALLGVLLNILFYTAALVFSHIAAYGTVYNLKINFVTRITRMPVGFHITLGSGALRKIMNENIESMENFIAHKLPDITAALTSPVIMAGILLWVDWRYAAASLVGIVIAVLMQVIFISGKKQQKIAKRYQQASENTSAASVEYIRGIAALKAFGQSVYSFKRLYRAIKRYKNIVILFSRMFENSYSAYITILNNMYLFLIPVGIWIGLHSNDRAAYAADFLFYLIIIPAVASIFMKLMYVSFDSAQTSGNIERMDTVLQAEILTDAANAKIPENYDITFENVSFSYDKTNMALQGVSFTAKEGEITMITGVSGSGKSTIAHLIPRFYDIDEGAVKISGVDIRDMKISDLANIVSFVFQDTHLFKTTFAENICMGRTNANKTEIVAAAKAARCHEFISALPQGYETVFGKEGIRLSGGEMQRVAIARAILKNAPILVLDEAAAFFDTENEYLIRQALNELMKNKTVVMIAHHLSAAKSADKIIVMDKGVIAEQGSEEELLRSQSLYVKLLEAYKVSLEWRFDDE